MGALGLWNRSPQQCLPYMQLHVGSGLFPKPDNVTPPEMEVPLFVSGDPQIISVNGFLHLLSLAYSDVQNFKLLYNGRKGLSKVFEKN